MMEKPRPAAELEVEAHTGMPLTSTQLAELVERATSHMARRKAG